MVDSEHIDSSATLEDLEAGHHITVVTVTELYLFMGRELETLDCMPAGNVLGTYLLSLLDSLKYGYIGSKYGMH